MIRLEAVRAASSLPLSYVTFSHQLAEAIKSDEAAIAKVLAEKDAEIERLRAEFINLVRDR